MRRVGAALLLGTMVLSSGCYRYTPVRAESVVPPMRVRAFLAPEGAERVRDVLGTRREVLDGRWVETTPEGVYIEVPSAVLQEGYRTSTLTQRLLIPANELMGIQRRQLDRFRTGLMAGAGVVLAAIVAYDALNGENGESQGSPVTGGPPEARLPILRIPVR